MEMTSRRRVQFKCLVVLLEPWSRTTQSYLLTGIHSDLPALALPHRTVAISASLAAAAFESSISRKWNLTLD